MLRIHEPVYALPDPPSKLKHHRRNPFGMMFDFLHGGQRCVVCRRSSGSISREGWLIIDQPKRGDVVCMECVNLNPQVFDWNSIRNWREV